MWKARHIAAAGMAFGNENQASEARRATTRGQLNMPATAEDLVQAARASGVSDERVLAAIAATPRRAFAPPGYAWASHSDQPIPIPHGLVTTQPSLAAVMIEGLGLTGSEHTLEIGTGYGYQTALLARLAADVTSIEIYPDIAETGRRNLVRQGIANVRVITADGTEGYPGGAPYDAVLISAAYPHVPPPLIAQLREGGRLVQPIGRGGNEEVMLFERIPDGLRQLRKITTASFVRLRGRHGFAYPLGTPGSE
jgi:protein-L-isoaspartate(D-aspartate) O-methyltransferase